VNLMPGFTRSDGTQQKDDLRFIFGIWMTAFPQTGLTGRHQN